MSQPSCRKGPLQAGVLAPVSLELQRETQGREGGRGGGEREEDEGRAGKVRHEEENERY